MNIIIIMVMGLLLVLLVIVLLLSFRCKSKPYLLPAGLADRILQQVLREQPEAFLAR